MNVRELNLKERVARARMVSSLGSLDAEQRVRWWTKKYFGGSTRRLMRWCARYGVADRATLISLVERTGDIENVTPVLAIESSPTPAHAPADLAYVWPYVRSMQQAADEAVQAAFRSGAVASTAECQHWLAAALFHQLSSIARESLTLAMHIARVEGTSKGDDAAARAADFARLMGTTEGREAVADRFPVLDRLLRTRTRLFTAAAKRFLNVLNEDLPDLRRTFFVSGPVVKLEFGLGDPHCGGQTVARVDFESGSLIFKPRAPETDRVFAEFAEWSVTKGAGPIPCCKTLGRADHGWWEFITPDECVNDGEVRTCYQSIGRALALLHALGGTDIHSENLICSGAKPYFVDLETLFDAKALSHRKIDTTTAAAFTSSVLRIGYLPQYGWHVNKVVDLSAAGLVNDQEGVTYVKLAGFDDDETAAEQAVAVIKPGSNAPRLGGVLRPAADHQDALIEGFTEIYKIIQAGREELLAADGLLERWSGVKFRWLARGTAAYAHPLQVSYHPRMLRDGVERELAFVSLALPTGRSKALAAALFEAELRDLWQGDIPSFYASLDSCDLRDGTGQVIARAFEETPGATLRARIKRFDHDGLHRQITLMRLAFETTKPLSEPIPRLPAQHEPSTAPSAAQLLEAAVEVGERIIRGAHMMDRRPFWPSIEVVSDDRGAVRMSAPSLYSGAPGVGVFFASLFAATGERKFESMAAACLRVARDADNASLRRIGAFNGAAGLLFAERAIAPLIGAQRPVQTSGLVRRIRRGIGRDTALDIIGGSAGAALVCAELIDECPEAADALLACANHLMDKATVHDDGASWPGADGVALTGFSHGACGIGLALAIAGTRLGRVDMIEQAWRALHYEAATYDADCGGWLDLRQAHKVIGSAWCHGAPGMALARQLLGDLQPNRAALLVDDIERGLDITANEHLHNHGLCHGALGNLEPLLRAGPSRAHVVEAHLARCWAERGLDDWRCDTQVPTASLMKGLAGIGLCLLRLAGQATPNVLTLKASPSFAVDTAARLAA